MVAEDPRLADAKAMPIAEIVDRLKIEGLRKEGRELVGPCPQCGGRDRFSVAPDVGLYNCRSCGGGDGIKLVQLVMNCDFKDALAFLCGERAVELSPEEAARRRERAAAEEKRREAEAERYRQQAIRDAKAIWARAAGATGTLGHRYLAKRGFPLSMFGAALPKCFRFLPDHPYVRKIDGELVTLHRGPCLITAVQAPSDELTAVHQTWIDLDQGKGKAEIKAADGTSYPAKMVRGSKKGGVIRLITPRGFTALVMGEGIETTLTAARAAAIPNAAYWAGVDLGNMAGRRGGRHSSVPDMSDERAFVPPLWVERLVFIQDGDSDPKETRAKLEAGLRRAMAYRPGLLAQIVHAGEGVDLNDVLLSGAPRPEGAADG